MIKMMKKDRIVVLAYITDRIKTELPVKWGLAFKMGNLGG